MHAYGIDAYRNAVELLASVVVIVTAAHGVHVDCFMQADKHTSREQIMIHNRLQYQRVVLVCCTYTHEVQG